MAVKRSENKIQPDKSKNQAVYYIKQTSIKREAQDIKKWRNAIRDAESEHVPRRTRLYDLYYDIDLDTHLTSQIEKRLLAITNQSIIFTDDKGNEVKDITKLCENEEFSDILKYCLESIFWGHSLIEFEFYPDKIVPYLVPRKHVNPRNGNILKNQWDIEGYSYRDAPHDNYVMEIGKPRDLGLLLKVAPWILYKRGDVGDWAQFCEVFGMPLRVGKYSGFDDETRTKLESALDNAGSAAYMVVPEEASVDFIESKANGSDGVFKPLYEACNKEISKAILLQTMTTEDGSSLSQAQVHEDVAEAVHFGDRLFIERILNGKFKKLLLRHGYKVENGRFGFAEGDTLTQKEQLDIALQVNNVAPVDKSYFYETFNLPASKEKPVQEQPQKKNDKEDEEIKNSDGTLFRRFLNIFRFSAHNSVITDNDTQRLYGNTFASIFAADDIVNFEKRATEIAEQIYKGTFTGVIDPGLTQMVAEKLSHALFTGIGFNFGDVDYKSRDWKLLNNLETNVYQFSAAKDYNQLQAMTQALKNEQGKIRSLKEFKKEVTKINALYNDNWLTTEYNTSLNAATLAGRWHDYKANAKTMPFIQYEAVNDERTRKSHAALDGVVKRIDDPFWDKYYPPNDYNCRCTTMQLPSDDEQETKIDGISLPAIPDMFSTNLAKQQLLFPPKHPYYKNMPKKVLQEGVKLKPNRNGTK